MENTSIFGIKFLSDKIQANASIKDIFSQRKAEMKTELSKWSGKLDRGEIFDEESNQDDFTNAVFKPLGYTKSGDAVPWTIKREYKTSGAKSVDLAIGYFKVGEDEDETVFAVAEYKSPLSKDLSRRPSKDMSPVEQAFDYASKIGHSCRWVIVSNMVEIRLYNSASQKRYETFNIHELAKEPIKLERFHFLLCKENFLPSESAKESFLDKLFAQNIEDQQTINAKFYSVYRQVREKFFMKLIESNPEVDRTTLLEKTQKVIDRFIFICFCEDKNFIGKSTLNEDPTDFIMNAPKKIFGGRIWDQFRQFSKAINDGSETPIKIPSFNGGLFEPDPDLDKLEVPNEAIEFFRDISDYDFNSTLDVNILGHIFEQSVSDIEELKAIAIDHVDFDRKKGKRKRQGIFYTPSWITGFIIEQTIGAWIEREKSNAGFGDLPVMSGEEDLILEKIQSNQKVKLPKTLEEKAKIHCNAWKKLQEKLLGIKVLDPACGSGAFLNKAFEYLVDAHKEIQSQINHFSMSKNDGQLTAGDKIDDYVVRNNLFGVDLSKESVEITKLSLWLRLVYHKEKLPALNHAVKYGDSIVSDPNYSKVAFDWQANFPGILCNPSPSGRRCPESLPSILPPPGEGGRRPDEGVLETDDKQPHPSPLLKGEGGFDVVIGNPPYVRQEFLSPIKPALQNIYGDFYNGVADLYTYFYKRAFQLLKPGGYLGLITSSTFTKTGSGANLREFLKTETTIDRFVDFGDLQLFGDATNYPCIIIARKTKPEDGHKVIFSGIDTMPNLEASGLLDNSKQIESLQSNLGSDAWNFDRPEVEALRTKIFSKGRPLKEIVPAIYRGILTGLNEAFIIDKATKDRLIKEELELRSKQPHPNPLLKGEGEMDSALLKGEGDNILPHSGEGGRRPDEGVLPWPEYNKRQNLLSYASSMRKGSTDAEKVLWEMLRDRRFLNLKFRRQHVAGDFILDFYCKEKEFAIELDGGQHTEESNAEYDKIRSDILQNHGIKVLRFWNNDVLNKLESVMEALYVELVDKQPHPNPLLKGEGEMDSALLKGKGDNILPPPGEGGRRPDEGVLIDSLTHNSHPLIKPFLVGRDLKQWHYEYQDRYLIFTRHGTDIDQYPAIKKYLEQFRERLEPKPLNLTEGESRNWKGRKPGPYKWFEIQDNIAYYKAFEEPKIVYPEIAIRPKFSLENGFYYTNKTVFILPYPHFWFVSILSSRIVWRVNQIICGALRGGMWRFLLSSIYVEQYPIVEPQGSEDDPSTDKGKLALLARTAQEKAFKRLRLRKDLLESVSDALNQSKSGDDGDSEEVSEGSDINRWDTMDWNSFTKKAQSPSAFGKTFRDTFAVIGKRTTELKRYFEELGTECRQLTCEIHECERQINEIVYRLYDLTPDEIKLLEELTGNIYED